MQKYTTEVAFPSRCLLGEASLWDQESGRLFWVDIADHKVFVFDPISGSNLAYDVGESVGTVVLTRNGKLVLGLRSGLACLDMATGKLVPLADPESHLPGNRFNDGKCDPQGRFWAGTMVEHGPPGGAALYCLDTDLNIEKKLDSVTISNGLVWTSDSKTFYYIDTPTHQVRAFDFAAHNGSLSNSRTIATIARGLGSPDGMAIDSEDHLWVALFHGGQVVRLNPTSGEIEAVVEVPAQNVTSCAFGGRELNELFITTARVGTAQEKLEQLPLAGSLFRAKVGVRGVASTRFGRDL